MDLIPPLLRGLAVTLEVTALTAPTALVVAFGLAAARLSPWWALRFVANVYLEIFRGTSALVQLFIFFYVLPLITGLRPEPIQTSVLALSLNLGAYASEAVRAAILGVDKGQREASIALNMSRPLMLRRIILPQAFRAMVPPFGNYTIELFKLTSVCSLISLPELTSAGTTILAYDARTTEVYLLMAGMYLMLTFPTARLFRRLESRITHGVAKDPVSA